MTEDAVAPGRQIGCGTGAARDITSGGVPMVVCAVAGVPALGWALIAASITPWADMGIVLARDGRRRTAFGVHGLTAALLVVAGVVLVATG